eukprot:g91.t1
MIVESAKRQVQTIQRCWRGFVGRRYFVQMRGAAMDFQAAFRTLRARGVFLQKRSATLQLQAAFQTLLHQDRMAAKQSAVVQIQAALRTAGAMAAHERRSKSGSGLNGLNLDASISSLGGGEALDSLRTELMARLERPDGRLDKTGGIEASHPLSSSFRQIPEPRFEEGLDLPMRKTIVNQRKIMEQLQQQFAEALIGKKEEELPSTAFDMEASQERQQQLEDEVRRLRRENGTLKTSLLSSQERLFAVSLGPSSSVLGIMIKLCQSLVRIPIFL